MENGKWRMENFFGGKKIFNYNSITCRAFKQWEIDALLLLGFSHILVYSMWLKPMKKITVFIPVLRSKKV